MTVINQKDYTLATVVDSKPVMRKRPLGYSAAFLGLEALIVMGVMGFWAVFAASVFALLFGVGAAWLGWRKEQNTTTKPDSN